MKEGYRMENYCGHLGSTRYSRLNDYIRRRMLDLEHFRQMGAVAGLEEQSSMKGAAAEAGCFLSQYIGETLMFMDVTDICTGMILRVQELHSQGFSREGIVEIEPAIPNIIIDIAFREIAHANEVLMSDCIQQEE
jgi:hypothetical protein